jgi:hypothetical protein
MADELKMANRTIEVKDYQWERVNRPKPPIDRGSTGRTTLPARAWLAAGAVLLAVSVVIAIELWPRKAQDAPQPTAARESTPPPSAPMRAQPLRANAAAPSAPPAAPRPASVEADPDNAAATETMEVLPITVAVIRGSRMIKARVVNSSGSPLAVTIQAINDTGQKSAEMVLNLEPFEQKLFTNEDLYMSPGDTLIFHNPQYADQTSVVR